MGLLTVPKKYNPPGNGKRDMEYPIFATKQEQGLLKAHGGSGKMTRHGIRSFGLGDRGNSVGSAGGSNYSGDGRGGQVNMNGVGMGGDKVLRQIDGRWTAVSRADGARIDAGGSLAPVRMKPAPVQYTPVSAPPVARPIQAPISLPPAASYFGDIASYAGTALPTKPTTYANSMPGNVNPALNYGVGTTSSPLTNQTPTLGVGGMRGSWTTPSRPPNNTPQTLGVGGPRGSYSAPASPNSMPGNSDPGMNYGPGTVSGSPQGAGGVRGSWTSPNLGQRADTSYFGDARTPTGAPNPGVRADQSYFGDMSAFAGSLPGVRYDPNGFQGTRAGNAYGGYPNAENGAYQGSLPGTVNQTAPLNSGVRADTSYFGDLKAPNKTYPTAADNAEIAALSSYLNRMPGEPSLAGRLAQTRLPGYGVPDLPNYGQTVNKTPPVRQAAGTLTSPYDQPASSIPTPRQNPLSDITKFTYQKNRDRDYVFSGMDQETISRAVKAQELFGSPVTATSGMRNPLLNERVGGAKTSQHMQGKAIDLSIPDKTGAATAKLIDAMQEAGFTGIGAYRPGKVHGDIGPARMWGPDTRAGSISQLPQNIQAAMYSSVPQKQTLVGALSPVVKSGFETIKDVFTPTPRQKPAMPNISPMGYAEDDMQAQNDLGPQPPENDIYERQNKLQQVASRIMDFMPNLSPGKFGTGGGDKRPSGYGYTDPRKPNAPPRTQDVTSPPAQPPVNPMTPWAYPQYQSQWAGLPTGIGGYARG